MITNRWLVLCVAASMNGNNEGRELVNNMRKRIVDNFQERMQLRRSLIELEDQNVQNGIEVSHEVAVLPDAPCCVSCVSCVW